MSRRLLAGLLGAAVIAAAGLPSEAQEKKAQPKKERIAAVDPKEAAKDPDFAIQGEYVGEGGSGNKTSPFGAHVVARGLGEFDVKVYSGGLPGAGWDGKTMMKGTARRTGDATAVTGKDVSGGEFTGNITGGKFAVKTVAGEGTLKKVERKSPTLGRKSPAGAVVLFGGPGDEKNWDGGKLTELTDGKFLNVGVKSRQKFQAFKAHIEFRTPWMPNSSGQGRGNSGVYLQDRYEVQVLDSFGLSGENNECGGIYTQHKPLVNMCLPPLTWQTYDIDFTPAQFEGEKKVKNGRVTIVHNGVKIHDDVEFPKECPGGQKETAEPGPFQFQNHGDPVVYNNVWVVEVK
jgi:hypothetical protein